MSTATWYAETPILIETLAETVEVSIDSVCEHLDLNATTYRPDAVAVNKFIAEFVAA